VEKTNNIEQKVRDIPNACYELAMQGRYKEAYKASLADFEVVKEPIVFYIT
jgi:hypothetical protein